MPVEGTACTLNVREKLESLRLLMRREGVDAFVTPSTDPHAGEYVPERWKSRRWLSGFTGSAGVAVVTDKAAALWTDSRYFIQAAEQLEGTEFELMRERIEGTPSVAEWLGRVLPVGSIVAVDGWVNTATEVEEMANELATYGLSLRTDIDPYAEIWTDRPPFPEGRAYVHELQYAGETAASKIKRIRQAVGGDAIVLSMLEEVAWTLNLRGNDVEYSPFVLAFALITPTNATLYLCEDKIIPEVADYLRGEGVNIRPYTDIAKALHTLDMAVWFDPRHTNYAVSTAVRKPVRRPSPVAQMLAVKNETEIAGFRRAMERDGVAMVKWMKWTLENVPRGGQTELSLAARLEAFRAEQNLYRGESFAAIVGYAQHGAIVHYEPSPDTDLDVKPEGLLLVDSGAQYLDGTTDITRTLPLGPLTWEMRRDYTLVLRGWIKLGSAVFPKGTCGTQLDALAREAMWKYGINYLHGTGHGVGQFMSVHETLDLHQFRMQWRPAPLLPGMTITDEPGIYVEGSHGVRHENTMLVTHARFDPKSGLAVSPGAQPYEGGEAQGLIYGPYYTFEHLTLCPVCTSPILVDMLSEEERRWFNDYQRAVCERLVPLLDDEHAEWLKEMTRPI